MHKVIYDHLTNYALYQIVLGISKWKIYRIHFTFCYTGLVYFLRSKEGHLLCVFDLEKAFDTVPHGQLMTKN